MPKTIIKRYKKTAQYFTEDLGNGIELEMVLIPGGSFIMGSPEEELKSRSNERPQHEVTIKPFCFGKYSVTQAQWQAVAALPQVNKELKLDPSEFKGDGSTSLTNHRPVESVSWHDAVEFCARLSNHSQRPYRLPSEAEWEYACRAGTTTPFHFGETITTDLANYNGNYTYGDGVKGVYRRETTEVGSLKIANEFGLYDMHGNVREWCQDDWHNSYEDAPIDGNAWIVNKAKSDKVLRGGSWIYDPEDCRSAYRYYDDAGFDDDNSGFRVVCGAAWTL
ncbi:formylglycine-generating enzyme family protein [Dolichospermum sp. UHCC 0259]|uniref:formylglycine-generating enzyme family protein n=1 Tax=Dolichospermum sp. UHCC 0259 TaxID=2590010 RepID=UPI001445458A|nr:formylglycine-generating enzyme family protein [Dolichospermum sp. UHCC 0259]MTJ48864.1 formylglycine-generating enzyme family protein [Dolichospermum sp. UHCC 0259]